MFVEASVPGYDGVRPLEREGTTGEDGEGGARFGGVAIKNHRLAEAGKCSAHTEVRRVRQGASVTTVFKLTIEEAGPEIGRKNVALNRA